MRAELLLKVQELRTLIQSASTPQPQAQAELSLSVPAPPDPCQPEVDQIGALLEEMGAFLDSWEPRFQDADEALRCCRIANPGSEPL